MMRRFRNVAVVLMLSVAAVVANSEWGASLVVDMFRTRSIRVEIKEQLELRDRLDDVNKEIFSHIAIKDVLIAELIEGRTTLAEVNRQFLVLDQTLTKYRTGRASCSGSTDEERTARNVLGYLRTELAHLSPAHRAEVLRRLNLEIDNEYPVRSDVEDPRGDQLQ